MKRYKIIALLLTITALMTTTGFAADSQAISVTYPRIEIPVSDEMKTLVTAGVTHEDGTTEVIQPEIRAYKLIELSRNAGEGDLYLIEAYAATQSQSGSDESNQCDASVVASMIYRAVGFQKNTLLEVHVTFKAGPEVHFGTRTVVYGGALNDTTLTEYVTGSTMNFDRRNINIDSDGVNGVYCGVTAPVTSWGATDELFVGLREWG